MCQQLLDYYIAQDSAEEEKYTRLKIEINQQAQKRGPDPNMDETTQGEVSTATRANDWEFDGTTTPLEVVNTNQHTVCYEFAGAP